MGAGRAISWKCAVDHVNLAGGIVRDVTLWSQDYARGERCDAVNDVGVVWSVIETRRRLPPRCRCLVREVYLVVTGFHPKAIGYPPTQTVVVV